jgi:hypothetical protein
MTALLLPSAKLIFHRLLQWVDADASFSFVSRSSTAVGILIGAQMAGFVVPMRISRRYPQAVRARQIATA